MRDLTAVGAALVLVAALGVVPAATSAEIGAGAGIDADAGTGADVGAGAGTGEGPIDAGAGAGANVDAGSGPAGGNAVSNAQAACSYPLTVTDATGTEITLEKAPQRVVTLAPSAAQTLWAFDASGKVVGVSDTAGYLGGASEKEVVTDGQTVRTEIIVGLEPDIVIAPDIIPDEKVEQLRSAGLTVYNTRPSTNFTDVYRKTERIGALAGECAAANATVTDMRERVTAIRDAVADEEHPGAMYVFYGYTAGSGTFIDSILTTAGLTNVAAEVGISGYGDGPVSPEVVANNSQDIRWLVFNSDPGSHPAGDAYNQTYAIRNDQTVVLNVNYLNQPGPRTVWALENLTEAVHPDAYAEAQAALEATPTATPTATDGSTTTGSATTDSTTESSGSGSTPTLTATADPVPTETTDEITTGSGPGFTAVVGVLAVLVAALFARRRR